MRPAKTWELFSCWMEGSGERLYLQQPSVLLAGSQSPLQLRYLLLQGSRVAPAVTEGVWQFVNLLSQLTLMLFSLSQWRGQSLLTKPQRRAPVFTLTQFSPHVRQPLL